MARNRVLSRSLKPKPSLLPHSPHPASTQQAQNSIMHKLLKGEGTGEGVCVDAWTKYPKWSICLRQEYRCLTSVMDISKGPSQLQNSPCPCCLRSFLQPNYHNSPSSLQSCFVTASLVWFLIALCNNSLAWKSPFGGHQPMTMQCKHPPLSLLWNRL